MLGNKFSEEKYLQFSHAVDKSGSERGCGVGDVLSAPEWDPGKEGREFLS